MKVNGKSLRMVILAAVLCVRIRAISISHSPQRC